MKDRRSRFLLFAAFFTLAGCSGGGLEAEKTGSSERAIVNGVDETGFEAVGALVYFQDSNHRSYDHVSCTGFLIRPNWVLTAAHCIYPEGELSRQGFLVGQHAEPSSDHSIPAGSRVYRLKRTISHPKHTVDNLYDIGLIELEQAVEGVEPLKMFEGNLEDYVGAEVRAIGYGATSFYDYDSEPRRRSTKTHIKAVYDGEYFVFDDHTGCCFGDSGGPDVMELSGESYAVGIHSCLLLDNNQALDTELCFYPTAMTRVDAYRSWVLKQMGEEADCHLDQSLCHCTEACLEDGQCEVYRCGMKTHCRDILRDEPESFDQILEVYGLIYSLSPESFELFQAFNNCIEKNFGVCSWWSSDCIDEGLACAADEVPLGSGQANCQETYSCLMGCTKEDSDCETSCFRNAKGEASILGYQKYACMTGFHCSLQQSEEECIEHECARPLEQCEAFDLEEGGQSTEREDGGLLDCGMEQDADFWDSGSADGSIGPGDGGLDAGNASESVSPRIPEKRDSEESVGRRPEAAEDLGCSAMPGVHQGEWFLLFALPGILIRRKLCFWI